MNLLDYTALAIALSDEIPPKEIPPKKKSLKPENHIFPFIILGLILLFVLLILKNLGV